MVATRAPHVLPTSDVLKEYRHKRSITCIRKAYASDKSSINEKSEPCVATQRENYDTPHNIVGRSISVISAKEKRREPQRPFTCLFFKPLISATKASKANQTEQAKQAKQTQAKQSTAEQTKQTQQAQQAKKEKQAKQKKLNSFFLGRWHLGVCPINSALVPGANIKKNLSKTN